MEVFTNTGKAGGCPSQSEATARLTSIALRSGISADEIIDQLKGIRCPSTIRQQGMSCTSCPDAIAKIVKKVDDFLKSGGAEQGATIPSSTRHPEAPAKRTETPHAEKAWIGYHLPTHALRTCPECGSALEHEGGCVTCRNCGFSKCG